MANSLTGIIKQFLPVESGQGKNGQWSKQTFVIETEGQYPKQVALSAWNDTGKAIINVPVGGKVSVQFEPESRENKGRWYTELKAFKFDVTERAMPFTDEMNK